MSERKYSDHNIDILALADNTQKYNGGTVSKLAITVRELRQRITNLEAQLQKSQRRVRQLYGALEGARRIAAEYYAFGLTGFEGEYTQIVNRLKDEPDWETDNA